MATIKTLKETIEKIVVEELSIQEDFSDFGEPESHSLSNLMKKDKRHVGDMTPEDFEKLLRSLVKRKYGKATLQRGDMEKLDLLTRWMQYIPGGHQYRRGLAKYLRSKKDRVRTDPFRDFRQYRYHTFEESKEQIVESGDDDDFLAEMDLPEEMFFHGSTADLNPGDIILPPSKTGKISEKGRKKNLDKVFFTKDFGSAKIYAGRAFHSLGGTPIVYQVEPIGEVQVLNDMPGTTVFTAEGARVVKKMPIV